MKVRRLVKWAAIGLTVAAIAQELRKPAGERQWNGAVAGFVPYDFRAPTMERVRERLWTPEAPNLISPQVFGVGWTVNFGRLARLVGLR